MKTYANGSQDSTPLIPNHPYKMQMLVFICQHPTLQVAISCAKYKSFLHFSLFPPLELHQIIHGTLCHLADDHFFPRICPSDNALRQSLRHGSEATPRGRGPRPRPAAEAQSLVKWQPTRLWGRPTAGIVHEVSPIPKTSLI